MCQGLLPSRRHIEKREDPGDEVADLGYIRDEQKANEAACFDYREKNVLTGIS